MHRYARCITRWGKLTDSDFSKMHGKKDDIVGRLRERCGLAKEEAEKEADKFAEELQ